MTVLLIKGEQNAETACVIIRSWKESILLLGNIVTKQIM